MNEKTYTWHEAWDLMVNHGKILKFINSTDSIIRFDENKKFFVDNNNDNISVNIGYLLNEKFIEYEQPKKFEWRTDMPDLDSEIIFVLKNGRKFFGTYEYISSDKSIAAYSCTNFWTVSDVEKWSYIPE